VILLGLEGQARDTEESPCFNWTLLSPFQRLMLIKVLCLNKLTGSVDCFVERQLGTWFTFSDDVTDGLRTVFEESSAKTPIIFILSPGWCCHVVLLCVLSLTSCMGMMLCNVILQSIAATSS